jgi:hypothetical protein
MLLSQLFGRQSVPSTRRPRPARKPLVESLEGRQLLSTFVDSPMIQGNHIGTSAVLRKHVPDAIQGNHIGTSAVLRKHVPDAIQGNHIGTPAIVGQHIGTNVA